MSFTVAETGIAPDYRAAKEGLAHRIRASAILDAEGPDRVAFLHGQLTQDVRGLATGQIRPAAGLTPRGKLLFVARLHALPDRLRLILPAASRARVLEHLKKYAVFQKVSVVDRSDELVRIGVYGRAVSLREPPAGAILLPGEGEFFADIVAPVSARGQLEKWLRESGSVPVAEETAEALRIESGRPRFGQDADDSYLADEVGLDAAISTTKGCYVGQEVVARIRTYGRVNKRLVGFRFPNGILPAGALLKRPDEIEPGKIEQGRVTSCAVSPALGSIGLGYAFREVPAGAKLVSVEVPARWAVVAQLPFA